MTARVWPLILVVACSRAAPPADDCHGIEVDPATAVARLSQKYPGAPVKVAEIVERCLAPSGTPCERFAKIVAAIPAMMPGRPAMPAPADPVGTCAGMPPEMQRCMFPSYMLAHGDECTKIVHDMQIAAIDVKPSTSRPPSPPCDDVRIEVKPDKIAMARGTATATVPRAAGAIDAAAFGVALNQFTATCIGAAVVAPTDTVGYQDIVLVMDLAMKSGFNDISIDAGGPTDQGPATPAPAPPGRDALTKAPVIIITRTEVSIGGTTIARVEDDVTAGVQAALVKITIDGSATPGLCIIQADQATTARTIKQAILGARHAGFDDLLFAVKNK